MATKLMPTKALRLPESVGVVYGGLSEEDRTYMEALPETEWSASEIVAALNGIGIEAQIVDPEHEDFVQRARTFDLVLLNCHGPFGEDGRMQGVLDMAGVAYTSSGVAASAVGMDKEISKLVFIGLGIDTPSFEPIYGREKHIRVDLKLPAMLKAVDGGSSIGIEVIQEYSELEPALERLRLRGFENFILEEYIDGRSITVSVVEIDGDPHVLPVVECQSSAEYYDEQSKLGKDPEVTTVYLEPSDLSDDFIASIKRDAIRIYRSLKCRGAIRVDFLVDSNNNAWALEINTIPGLQSCSNLPESARLAGISYEELLCIILKSAWGSDGVAKGVSTLSGTVKNVVNAKRSRC